VVSAQWRIHGGDRPPLRDPNMFSNVSENKFSVRVRRPPCMSNGHFESFSGILTP